MYHYLKIVAHLDNTYSSYASFMCLVNIHSICLDFFHAETNNESFDIESIKNTTPYGTLENMKQFLMKEPIQ